jgi:N-acetylmuramoyl-L-alanine amidase
MKNISMTIRTCVVALAAFLAFFAFPLYAAEESMIHNIRHWAAPDHTRVVFDTSDNIPYSVDKADNKLQLHFKNTKYSDTLSKEIILKKPGIEKIVMTETFEGDLKVELRITDQSSVKVFKLTRIQEKPERIVVDIEFPELAKQEKREREQVKVFLKNKIVVIDPGHGGEAPGAVGRCGTYEKNVVLEISRKLKKLLDRKNGYRAFLTRDGDYYVPFKKRLNIAREYGADLFISIHADSFRQRSAKGSSVYCLSVSGATSVAAKMLAKQENLADIIGGSQNGESGDESDPILLNMFQTNTINASRLFGISVLKRLENVGHIKHDTVQEAQFRVLKLPEIPSILVETAYISNLKEERLLKSDRYQMEIAKAITASVMEFLPVNMPTPIPETILTKKEDKDIKEPKGSKEIEPQKEIEVAKIIPEVKETKEVKEEAKEVKGPKEIIEVKYEKHAEEMPITKIIAEVKKNRVTETKHMEHAGEAKTKAQVRRYRVEKGDTMEKIAKERGMTLANLLKLNNMKLCDPLYAGQKIKVEERKEEAPALTKKTKLKESDVNATDSQDSVKQIFTYRVKKGDTIEKIARAKGTNVETLLKMNHMKLKDPLYAGVQLKIEGSEDEIKGRKETAAMPRPFIYKVRRGDTLDKIAKKHKTSISELRKLNEMKKSDVLYYDKKLKVPQDAT